MPLVEYYQLERASAAEMFPIYQNDIMHLVISGIGKTLSAAATSYLHATCGAVFNQPFLNIGVAGHFRDVTGTAMVANHIIEAATGKSWYPAQVTGDTIERTLLMTVDIVENEYLHDAAYDMEAAGFYPVACRASTIELVQSLKVISDHPNEPVTSLNENRIESLIEDRIDDIDYLASELEEIAKSVTQMRSEMIEISRFTKRWTFSMTQQHRLHRLLERWALLVDKDPLAAVPNNCPDGGHVIKVLENILDTIPLDLHTNQTK